MPTIVLCISLLIYITYNLMFFQVKNPQLEYEPGQFREGLKRYNFNKNMNSFDFPSITRPQGPSNQNYPLQSDPNPSSSAEVLKLKQQLQIRQQEVDRLKFLTEGSKSHNASPQIKNYQETVPFRATDRSQRSSYDYNLFEIAKHPAFQQPKFTKRNPKVVSSNPISGFQDRSFGQYGNFIVNNRPIS